MRAGSGCAPGTARAESAAAGCAAGRGLLCKAAAAGALPRCLGRLRSAVRPCRATITCQCYPHLQCPSATVLVWRDSAAPIILTMIGILRDVLLSTSVTCTKRSMSCGAGPRLLGTFESERGFTVVQCSGPYHQLSAGQAPLLGGPGTGGVGKPATGGRARAPPDADTARSARRPGLLMEVVDGGCQPA